MSIGFIKFELKQWLSAYQDKVCAWFSLARLPTETAGKNFSGSFSKRNGFSFLLLASRTCSIPRGDIFVPYLLPSYVKYYPNDSRALSAILKQQREKLCNDDVNRASVL